MNKNQKHSITRQLIMAVSALLVSFGMFGESDANVIVPALTGLVLWTASPSRNWQSAIRKVAQVIPPVLLHYRLIDASQSAALITVLLTFASMSVWTIKEKSNN